MKLTSFTWYDLLGVLPGASTQQISGEYRSKASLLQPAYLSGAPSPVIAAASRAQQLLDAAWRVLCDPASRRSYDEAAGILRIGEGLVPPDTYPSQPSLGDVGFVPGSQGASALGFLMALSDLLAPRPRQYRRLPVPDVRGLFYSVGLDLTSRIGFHLIPVQLTLNPMPVDGLIVDQRPPSPAMLRRDGDLTVQVWHPPARPAK